MLVEENVRDEYAGDDRSEVRNQPTRDGVPRIPHTNRPKIQSDGIESGVRRPLEC